MSDDAGQYWGVLIAVNIPVFIGLGKLMFGSWGDFWECVTFWVQPGSISAMLGELDKDAWAEVKLLLFVVLCGALIGIEHLVLVEIGWAGAGAPAVVGGAESAG
jgi:hypothetical protein